MDEKQKIDPTNVYHRLLDLKPKTKFESSLFVALQEYAKKIDELEIELKEQRSINGIDKLSFDLTNAANKFGVHKEYFVYHKDGKSNVYDSEVKELGAPDLHLINIQAFYVLMECLKTAQDVALSLRDELNHAKEVNKALNDYIGQFRKG